MRTTLAINTCSRDLVLPRATSTVACIALVSCERVRIKNGVLHHSKDNRAIPASALRFFDADVRGEIWPEPS
jgi:hypothetical protein